MDRNGREIASPQAMGHKEGDQTLGHDRPYEKSHPWITFECQKQLDKASAGFWMLLGEIRSKCDHIRYVPLAAETANQLHQVYFAKGVNATTAIEGNTLSEEQVQARLKGQLALPVSKEYLGREIDNMIGAYNRITNAVRNGDRIPISPTTLCELNKEILAGLPDEPHVVPGEFRQYAVAAGPYVGAPWPDVPFLLDKLCDWLASIGSTDEPNRVPTAFIKAVLAHVYIEWIHPFGNGNGRLGRLIEFLVLVDSGVPLPAAHILTSHYNDTRTEYYRQLNEASQNGGDLRSFLAYAAQGLVDGLVVAIKQLHRQQEQLMWRAMVDEAYIDQRTAAAHRQRLLAIELGVRRAWVKRSELRRLTPPLVEAYYGKTPKTLSRDINRLRALQLVEPDMAGSSVRAKLSRVRGMRPFALEN